MTAANHHSSGTTPRAAMRSQAQVRPQWHVGFQHAHRDLGKLQATGGKRRRKPKPTYSGLLRESGALSENAILQCPCWQSAPVLPVGYGPHLPHQAGHLPPLRPLPCRRTIGRPCVRDSACSYRCRQYGLNRRDTAVNVDVTFVIRGRFCQARRSRKKPKRLEKKIGPQAGSPK
jgi:hypothetical protein